MRSGYSAYLLLTPWQARKFTDDRDVEKFFSAEKIATIAPESSADFFVAMPGQVGAPIELVRLHLRDKALSATPPAAPD